MASSKACKIVSRGRSEICCSIVSVKTRPITAAAVMTWDWCKNVFVFDEDIDVYNPTEILWALATRVQPHRQVSIIGEIMRASLIDPSLENPLKTSVMIVDATRPLDQPFSPVSKCPDEALARTRLEDYVPGEVLNNIPVDRTTYWA